MRSRVPVLLVLFAAFAIAACGGDAGATAKRRLVVFAASSLTASFEALAAEFERRHDGVDVQLHFAGTPQLVLQLQEGAPGDVFASADEANMQKVVDAGRTAARPQAFATNGLAIVVAAGNPRYLQSLADLARPDLKVALCAPDVPAGRYARAALARAGVVVPSVSDEPSVAAVCTKVRLGEIDAGIVYRTDVRSDGVDEVRIAPADDVVAVYPIATLAGARAGPLAAEFVEFVRSPAGQRILAGFGFGAP